MIFYDGGEDACTNPECVHDEVNAVKWCSECGKFSMILRDPRTLPDGAVYAYDPLCGVTYHVRIAQA